MASPKPDEVWVKLEGVLAEALDPPSTWAIGAKTAHADEVIALAKSVGAVTVYGDVCQTVTGLRAARRWVVANSIDAWLSHEQTPPPGAEVIDRWPM